MKLTEAETVKADAAAALADYNSTLAMVDDKYNSFTAKDKFVRAFNKKVLPAAGLKYGTDSSEYEQLGGVRDSDRKRRTPKPKPVNP